MSRSLKDIDWARYCYDFDAGGYSVVDLSLAMRCQSSLTNQIRMGDLQHQRLRMHIHGLDTYFDLKIEIQHLHSSSSSATLEITSFDWNSEVLLGSLEEVLEASFLQNAGQEMTYLVTEAHDPVQRRHIGLQDDDNLVTTRRLLSTNDHYAGIHSTYAYISPSQSYTSLHREDFGLQSANYLHAGRAIWVVIPPRHTDQLEARIRALRSIDEVSCHQFVRHENIIIPPQVLRRWGISFQIVLQKPGELIITDYHAYHYVWNPTAKLAEAVNICEETWLPPPTYLACSTRVCGVDGISHEGMSIRNFRILEVLTEHFPRSMSPSSPATSPRYREKEFNCQKQLHLTGLSHHQHEQTSGETDDEADTDDNYDDGMIDVIEIYTNLSAHYEANQSQPEPFAEEQQDHQADLDQQHDNGAHENPIERQKTVAGMISEGVSNEVLGRPNAAIAAEATAADHQQDSGSSQGIAAESPISDLVVLDLDPSQSFQEQSVIDEHISSLIAEGMKYSSHFPGLTAAQARNMLQQFAPKRGSSECQFDITICGMILDLLCTQHDDVISTIWTDTEGPYLGNSSQGFKKILVTFINKNHMRLASIDMLKSVIEYHGVLDPEIHRVLQNLGTLIDMNPCTVSQIVNDRSFHVLDCGLRVLVEMTGVLNPAAIHASNDNHSREQLLLRYLQIVVNLARESANALSNTRKLLNRRLNVAATVKRGLVMIPTLSQAESLSPLVERFASPLVFSSLCTIRNTEAQHCFDGQRTLVAEAMTLCCHAQSDYLFSVWKMHYSSILLNTRYCEITANVKKWRKAKSRFRKRAARYDGTRLTRASRIQNQTYVLHVMLMEWDGATNINEFQAFEDIALARYSTVSSRETKRLAMLRDKIEIGKKLALFVRGFQGYDPLSLPIWMLLPPDIDPALWSQSEVVDEFWMEIGKKRPRLVCSLKRLGYGLRVLLGLEDNCTLPIDGMNALRVSSEKPDSAYLLSSLLVDN